MSPRLDFAPFRTNYLFLLTTVLALIAWFIAFVSQSISTAQFGNKFVGVLWFAIFLQGFLTAGVILAIATDSVQTCRMQLAIFAAMAAVFGVDGVQQGIFSGFPAVFMTAAGYLVLAIVDLIWVLYFTSGEDSPILHLFNRMGTGGLVPPAHQIRRMTHRQSVVSDSVYDKDKPNYGVSSENVAQDPDLKRGSAVSDMSSRRVTLPRSGTGGPSITRGKSLVTVGSVYSEALVDGSPPVPQLPPPPTPTPPGSIQSIAESEVGISVSAGESVEASPEAVVAVTNVDDGEGWIRARALHAYKGSRDDPNELSFLKGEILEIEDRAGKWWEAKKADGTFGIVPSNYMVIL
ncbi:hypothetical protein B0H11DRAFT_2275359 [Mycena galericulata]|nr:hypothetical protein B0H11DRAFT_2275359 [Mycena galericulata]